MTCERRQLSVLRSWDIDLKAFNLACVASVSGAKNYSAKNGMSKRGGRGRGRKEGNACRQTPGF